jgi:hypothetical protein
MRLQGRGELFAWPVRATILALLAIQILAASTAPAMATLPDGRAYELVSPPDTGAVTPDAAALGQVEGLNCFDTSLVSADGEGVVFASQLGALEGLASNGVRNLYESNRSPSGWITQSKSATGRQTTHPGAGLCMDSEHEYSTLRTGGAPFDEGELVLNGASTSYVRAPAGDFLLIGVGSIGTDQRANVRWISPGGGHIIFTAVKRLEPPAPEGIGSGESYLQGEPAANAVYDRTPLGVAVLSLLPSGLSPNPAIETTFFRGASMDGSAVVFEVVKGSLSTLYVRKGGITKEIATGTASGETGNPVGEVRFGGISANGTKVVYVDRGNVQEVRGDIYEVDTVSGASVPVTTGAEAALVNVSDDGSAVYFISEEALTGSGQNGLGQSAQTGQPNLYHWDGVTSTIHYVATVAALDAEESFSGDQESLTEWIRTAVRPQRTATLGRMNASSRTNPTGSVFVFQARGDVAGYDSGSHIEIYRYASGDGSLTCISCPSGAAASDAFLQLQDFGPMFALNALAVIPNVSSDGGTVFFMTSDPLVGEDVNGTLDVYEWRNGAVSLISSGRSSVPSMLYAMSPDARDVFFLTTEQLLPQDISSVQSIYDARIGGGFPPPPQPPSPCEGDSCQPPPTPPPAGTSPASEIFSGPPSPQPRRHKRKHKRHRRKHHAHRANLDQTARVAPR